jgi:hypothetical protein
MGRRKKTFVLTGEKSASENPIAAEPKPSEESATRVSFSVEADGSPDWERMQEKSREKLREVLQNPEVQRELEVSPAPAPKKREISKSNSEEFGEDEANAFLDMLSGVDSFAASKIYAIPRDVTDRAFAFEDYHRKKLTPPMIRLMNKWAPLVLKTWKDEIGFALVMFSTVNAQVRIMHHLEKQRKKSVPNNVSSINASERAAQEQAAPMAPAPPQAQPEKKTGAVAEREPDFLDAVGFSF